MNVERVKNWNITNSPIKSLPHRHRGQFVQLSRTKGFQLLWPLLPFFHYHEVWQFYHWYVLRIIGGASCLDSPSPSPIQTTTRFSHTDAHGNICSNHRIYYSINFRRRPTPCHRPRLLSGSGSFSSQEKNTRVSVHSGTEENPWFLFVSMLMFVVRLAEKSEQWNSGMRWCVNSKQTNKRLGKFHEAVLQFHSEDKFDHGYFQHKPFFVEFCCDLAAVWKRREMHAARANDTSTHIARLSHSYELWLSFNCLRRRQTPFLTPIPCAKWSVA